LQGLAAVATPRRTFKKIPKLSISKVFIARKFEVSEADFAATLRGGHFRNATTCPCLVRIAARAVSRNSNQISCRNGKHRMLIIEPENKNQHFKNPACLRAVGINRKK
jgi:hypothetical protein